MKYRTRWIIVSVILLVLFAVAAVFIDQQIIKSSETKNERVTLRGVSVCLPHANPGEVQTLECAIGLKATDGKYYSIADTSFFDTDVKIEVSGNIIPPEKDSKYKIDGTIEKAEVRRLP